MMKPDTAALIGALAADNCHRGAVVGALLGEANGVPAAWRDGLVNAGR